MKYIIVIHSNCSPVTARRPVCSSIRRHTSSTLTPGSRFGQHERQHLSLRRHELQRLRVARVDDRKRLKRAARLADADDLRLVVVHFEPLADPRLLVRPEQLVAFEVHDHGVRLAQVEQVAEDHVGRRADKRGIIEPQQNRLLEIAVLQPRAREALVQPHRPGHARHAANAIQIAVRERLDVVRELHVGVHHPDVGALDVANLPARLQHQAAKDRRLLGDQQRGERDAQDDAQVLAAVAGQHFERDPVHRVAPAPIGRAVLLDRRQRKVADVVGQLVDVELGVLVAHQADCE